MTSPVTLAAMTDDQRAAFHAYYPSVQREELTGVLLALFLGSFGAHHFYLRRNALGALYLLLSWTSIPLFLGVIEAFFMPERVRRLQRRAGSHAGLLCRARRRCAGDDGMPGVRQSAVRGCPVLRAVWARDGLSVSASGRAASLRPRYRAPAG